MWPTGGCTLLFSKVYLTFSHLYRQARGRMGVGRLKTPLGPRLEQCTRLKSHVDV